MDCRHTECAGDVRCEESCERYQLHITQDREDPAWDAFLHATPGGHHVQTSLWAQVKALAGWQAVRVIVKAHGKIIGGGQLLIKQITPLWAIAHVSKGPVIEGDDAALAHFVMQAILRVAKHYRVVYLLVQPPNNGSTFAHALAAWGFQRTTVANAQPIATTLVDLTQDLACILQQMKSKTRYHIRLSERKGITVREGAAGDFPIFYQMVAATAQRQQFTPEPMDYLAAMLRILGARGHCKLFLAEFQGEPLSALLAVPFGNTMIYKRGGWSGDHRELRPNEALHWAAMQWAKAQGYQFYDFEGIDPHIAHAVASGELLDSNTTATVTRFKLGFGGEITFFPAVYAYVDHPVLRWAYHTIFPRIKAWPVVTKLVRFSGSHS